MWLRRIAASGTIDEVVLLIAAYFHSLPENDRSLLGLPGAPSTREGIAEVALELLRRELLTPQPAVASRLHELGAPFLEASRRLSALSLGEPLPKVPA